LGGKKKEKSSAPGSKGKKEEGTLERGGKEGHLRKENLGILEGKRKEGRRVGRKGVCFLSLLSQREEGRRCCWGKRGKKTTKKSVGKGASILLRGEERSRKKKLFWERKKSMGVHKVQKGRELSERKMVYFKGVPRP